ncbi:MAG: HYExAFE family protein [Planctomycetes bacterium]|nr:HYExAFE family protein [Planctomycetota bacterium]
MTNRSNHYEHAFESYLRDHRVAYVAVNEQRRSLVAHGSLKSLDFIAAPCDSVSLLIDIKGRRFPSGERHKQYWRNWSTWDDLQSMAQWQDKLGVGSCSLLVFAFDIVGSKSPLAANQLYPFREHRYAFLAIRVADYIQFAKPLSAKWQTMAMPNRLFREAAFPFDDLLVPQPPNTPPLLGEPPNSN